MISSRLDLCVREIRRDLFGVFLGCDVDDRWAGMLSDVFDDHGQSLCAVGICTEAFDAKLKASTVTAVRFCDVLEFFLTYLLR